MRRSDLSSWLHAMMFSGVVVVAATQSSCSPSEPDGRWTFPDLAGTWTLWGIADPAVRSRGRCQFGPFTFSVMRDRASDTEERRVFRGSRPATQLTCATLTLEEIERLGLVDSRLQWPAAPIALEVHPTPVYTAYGLGVIFEIGGGDFGGLILEQDPDVRVLRGELQFPNGLVGTWEAARH